MRKKINIFALLLFVSSAIWSCNSKAMSGNAQNSDINKVSYSHTIGRGGFVKILATRDSLISTKFGTAFNDIPAVKRKMKSGDWNKLISVINGTALEHIKSGERRGYYDGPDEIFEITTKKKNYHFINVADSTQYRPLGTMKNLLKKLTVSQ